MRKILLLFFVSLSIGLAAQTNPLWKADSLKIYGQYQASLAFLSRYIQDHPNRIYDLSDAYFLMSYDYLQLGNYEKALKTNAKSQELRGRLLLDNVGENFMRSGTIYAMQGDYERALDYLLRAKELPADAELLGLINGYIGNVFLELKEFAKAEFYFQEAFNVFSIELGEDHPDIATNAYNLGRTYLAWGKKEKAKEQFEQALKIAEQNKWQEDLKGRIYNALGETFIEKSQASRSFNYYQNAVATFLPIFGQTHPELARTYLNIAELAFLKEDFPRARASIKEAINSLCPNFNSNSFENNPQQNEIVLDKNLLVKALQLKANLLLAEFEQRKNQSSLDLALSTSELGLYFLDEQLDFLTTDLSRYRILEDHSGIYEVGISAAHELLKQTGNESFLERAFNISEKSKANLLRVNMAPPLKSKPQFASLLQEERQLQSDLKGAELKLALNPKNISYQNEVRTKRQQIIQYIGYLKQQIPNYYKLRYDRAVVTLSELKNKLAKEDALLSYFLGKNQYYLFCITNGQSSLQAISNTFAKPRKKKKGGWKKLFKDPLKTSDTGGGVYSKLDVDVNQPDLEESINKFLRAVKKVKTKQFGFYGSNLYEKLIYPVEKLIDNKQRLHIIPHKSLYYIPFEALLKKAPKPEKVRYHKLNYLINDFDIQYHYAATLWANPQPPSKPASVDFAGFAPVFNSETSTGYIGDNNHYLFDTTYQTSENFRSTSPDGRVFKPLRFSENEILKIAEIFSKNEGISNTYLFEKASEAQFKTAAKNARFLHLATHSFINEANPKLSGIAFAQSTIPIAGEDGILFSPETYDMDLKTELVVLSSCESGAGKLVEGDGLLSLSRGFLQSGAHYVMSSMWSVYDRYTTDLMLTFYKQVLQGKSFSAALRAAKISMIKKKDTADPRKWAAFLLIGS